MSRDSSIPLLCFRSHFWQEFPKQCSWMPWATLAFFLLWTGNPRIVLTMARNRTAHLRETRQSNRTRSPFSRVLENMEKASFISCFEELFFLGGVPLGFLPESVGWDPGSWISSHHFCMVSLLSVGKVLYRTHKGDAFLWRAGPSAG